MKINILGNEIELKYTMRSLMIYESIQKKSFEPNSLTDILVYIYATILASKKDLVLEFDDYLDWIDEHSEIITEFTEWLQSNITKQQMLSPEIKGEKTTSKKK